MPRHVVAITGASSGIGEEFARRLAPDHDLLLIARRGDKLHKLAGELFTKYGCQADVMAADLSQAADTAAVADRLEQEPLLAMLINNAGFGTKGRFWESSLASQEQMHQLHVMATVRLTHAALGNLVAKDGGAIINVSSVSAYVRSQGAVSYCATKAWMSAFTEGLYLELKAMGSQVRVQALCPGFTYSGFHDAMGVDRSSLAGGPFWMTSQAVVDASLEGLRRKKLFVIPGWRYRALASLVSKLPAALRLRMEEMGGRVRTSQILQAQEAAKQL